jgi:type II secretory pathway component PulF
MMAVYRYRALKDSGEMATGTIEGPDRSLVLSRLSRQGLHPIEVEEQIKGDWAEGQAAGRISADEMTVFTRQLAWLLESGTTLDRALDMLAREAFSKPFSAMLVAVQSGIRKGKSLHEALRATHAFPPFYLSMVEIGEATGTLAAAFGRLATAREREQKMRSKVISALTYPLLLVVLAIGVVAFIMVAVVPGIRDMISEAGAPIPESAGFVIAVSDWLIAYGLELGVLMAVMLLGAALLWRRSRLPWLLRDAMLHLPGIGTLIMKSEAAQFCRVLGALTAAGMALPASLKLIDAMPVNRRIAAAVRGMETALRRGEDFVVPLEASGILPPLLARLLKTGAETGNLTPSIMRAGEMLEDELERAADRALALLGPLIILLLSVFVGFIIVSLMGAILSINDLAI